MSTQFFFFVLILFVNNPVFLPVKSAERQTYSEIQLTDIGTFGMIRKPRPGVPAHLHTGIDIKRPSSNYQNEPVYPVSKGKVISKRTDGPFANLIIEHELAGKKFWTVYEHIAGIKVKVMEQVEPMTPVARFMNREELNKFGWQFDHFHLEILKQKPVKAKPNHEQPDRFYNSYTLTCFSEKELARYFDDPVRFFKSHCF